jgi:hypothetical protein
VSEVGVGLGDLNHPKKCLGHKSKLSQKSLQDQNEGFEDKMHCLWSLKHKKIKIKMLPLSQAPMMNIHLHALKSYKPMHKSQTPKTNPHSSLQFCKQYPTKEINFEKQTTFFFYLVKWVQLLLGSCHIFKFFFFFFIIFFFLDLV